MALREVQLGNAKITASARLHAPLPPLFGDKDQLQQVLLNLYMNAIQATPRGGRLEVRTSRVSRRRPGLEVAPEEPYAVLEVADTGLGLAVAHGIVKDHDGWIEIDDNEAAGRGTVFRVFLPLTAAPARDEHGANEATGA
jgi:signal transduction histidine kinase